MLIEGSDFIVRPLVMSDADSLFTNYKGRVDCAKYVSSDPHINIAQTRQFISQCLKYDQATEPTLLIFAIAEPCADEVIGLLVFVFNETHAEIHFGVAKEYSGRGIATEVCIAGVNFLKQRGVIEVRTQPYFEHHASLKVLKKCGFKQHGLLHNFALFPRLGKALQACADMRLMLD